MTPKEKAKEIHRKMCNSFYHVANDLKYDISIKCALIAVDEIIKILSTKLDFEMKKSLNYWYEVKQEIEKL